MFIVRCTNYSTKMIDCARITMVLKTAGNDDDNDDDKDVDNDDDD